MLSVETNALLRSLLVAIGEGEISIEKQRKVLGKLVKFEPYCSFQRIDRRRTGFVDSMDILTFLRDNGFTEETEADTYYLMKFFDVDDDNKLNYTEFLTLVLPCDNAQLRNEIIMRPNYYVGLLDFLPKTIEYELCKLFVKEIAFHRRIEAIKQELACKSDFDRKSGFKTIDDWTYNYIDFSNLKRFLKSTGHVATNKELAAIIRRLDLNADSRLSFDEFEEGIKPAEPYSKITLSKTSTKGKSSKKLKASRPKTAKVTKGSKTITKPKKTQKSKLKSPNSKLSSVIKEDIEESKESRKLNSFNEDSEAKLRDNEIRYRSPLRADRFERTSPYRVSTGYDRSPSYRYESPHRVSGCRHHIHYSHSPSRHSPVRYSPTRYSPERHSPIRHSPYRYSQTKHFSESNPRNPPVGLTKYDNTLRHTEEKEFVNTLKDLLDMELDLEKSKINLSLKPDFNLIDLFRMFDIENKGYITFDEFRSGLYLFHLYPNHDDAFLLFSRYETVSDGILRYSDFCDIFCPKSEEHNNLLTTRPSYYIHKPYYRISEFFHPDTRLAVEVLLADNLRVESVAETMRQHLSLIPTFNIMDAFNTIDMKDDGYLSKTQFKLLLEAHGVHAKQSELLVDRFDKNKDGKVSYGEFADEVRPKSPIRRARY